MKKPHDIVANALRNAMGDHAAKIDPTSFDAYKANLKTIFDRAAAHGDKIITFVLPGFPYKSGNTDDKTFGHLPDLGDVTGLKTLNDLMHKLSRKTGYDCHLVICSDGFAFNDIKDLSDRHVTDYRDSLRDLARDMHHITIKDMDDLFDRAAMPASSDKRSTLMDMFGRSKDDLHAAILRDPNMTTLYTHLTFYMMNDMRHKKGGLSNKAYKKMCKSLALDVMARSEAWAGLVKRAYPDAVRLTIHPYTDVSHKMPIKLVDAVDGRWRTPWHNVPVITPRSKGFLSRLFMACDVKLAPHKDARAQDAVLIKKNSRNWCFMDHKVHIHNEVMMRSIFM